MLSVPLYKLCRAKGFSFGIFAGRAMEQFITRFKELMGGFDAYNAAEVLLLSLAVYITFKFLISHNSVRLVKVLIFAVLTAFVFVLMPFTVLDNIAPYFLLLAFIFIVVLYSSEIKRFIWSKSRSHLFEGTEDQVNEDELKFAVEEIVKAVQNMAKRDIGALIVLVEGQTPMSVLESGVPLYSNISSQLLESVFIPKSPLHDGAVLIKGNKILAAGCFLPLSQEINLSKEYGTRHRAALGISEQQNVTAIVVSEETGIISMAKSGQLKRYLDGEMLKSSLEKVYGLSGQQHRRDVHARWKKRR